MDRPTFTTTKDETSMEAESSGGPDDFRADTDTLAGSEKEEEPSLSLLCLLNNKAANLMERKEYDAAELVLREALSLLDSKREQDSPSPTTVVDICCCC
jgi:hypothetical protein